MKKSEKIFPRPPGSLTRSPDECRGGRRCGSDKLILGEEPNAICSGHSAIWVRLRSFWSGFDFDVTLESSKDTPGLAIYSFWSLMKCFMNTANDWSERVIDSSAFNLWFLRWLFQFILMYSNALEHPQMHLHAMCWPAFAHWSFHWFLNVV